MQKKAYTIISGGMDSTLATFMVKDSYDEIIALFFDWGQKSVEDEWAAVNQICDHLEIASRETIRVPIDKWDQSSLTKGDPHLVDDDFMVPERNLIFISLAASFARANGGGSLIVGFNKDDGGYDTSKQFVDQINDFFDQGTKDLEDYPHTYLKGTAINLVAPLIDSDKKEIRTRLQNSGLFNLTYTCYVANGPCAKCKACKKREAATVSFGTKPVEAE